MDLYEDLVMEVLLSDVSTKGWREFEKKYLPLAGRGDLFVQFTNFSGSVEDKRLVGMLAPSEYEQLGAQKQQDFKAITKQQAVPDVTLWIKPTHGDPTAIYTYPLEYVVHHPTDIRYGFNSRFLRILKLKPGTKVLDLQSLTKDHALNILKQMGIELPQGWNWETFWEMGLKYAKPGFSGTPLTAPKIFFFLAQHEFEYVNPTDSEPFPATIDNNAQRARFVRAHIGVVQDTAKSKSDAVIHWNEPEQAFFMRRGDFEIVDAYRIAGKEGEEIKEPSISDPALSIHGGYEHIEMKAAANLLKAIDQRDQIVGAKKIYGGYETVSNPLPMEGHIDINPQKRVVFTRRGRAITVNAKTTGEESEHRSRGRHLPFEIDISLDSEAGHQSTKITREEDLNSGINRIAVEYRKAKPDSEWKPFRGVNDHAVKWRELLSGLSMVHYPSIDLDALKQAAPLVCEKLHELFSLVGWHWKVPTDVWQQIAAWHVADTIYKDTKKVYSLEVSGLKKVTDRQITDLGSEDHTYPIHPSELKRLKNTKVGEAAYTLADAFGITKPSNEIMSVAWGMQHFFLKRMIVAMEGAFPNFHEGIATDLFKLIEGSKPEVYKIALHQYWKDLKEKEVTTHFEISKDDYSDEWLATDQKGRVLRIDPKKAKTEEDAKKYAFNFWTGGSGEEKWGTAERFNQRTNEHPDPAWLIESVNEDIKAIDTKLTKDQIRIAIEEVKSLLSSNGITQPFTVKLRPTTNKNWIAQYRGGSAFRGRPIFWINPDMGKTLYEKFGSGYYNQRDFDYAITMNLRDTLIHEYGHAVADVIKLNFRMAGSPFNGLDFGQEVSQDEEDFAEKVFNRVIMNQSFMKQPWAKYYFGKEDINEVIVARPDSVGTATGTQLTGKEFWRNPSKQAAFISPQKQLPQTHNRYIASAKRTIERAVQRTLTWVRDPSTNSETAYIGHGRKVRVGFDNPSLSPMTIKLNAKKMPSVEKLKTALT